MTLLFDEAALAGSVGDRLVLQRALAALVADRAVERVVDEQELEDAVLRLLGDVGFGLDDHAVAHREHAARLQAGAAAGVDLDEAHTAHADRLHARVVAEPRDVDAVAFGGGDEQFALLRHDLDTVDRDWHAVGHFVGLGLGCGHAETSTAVPIFASNSWRKRRMADVIGATDDGPSGQIVVWRGGNGTASRPSASWDATG